MGINDETDHNGIANPIESLIDSALKAKKSGQRSLVTRVIEPAHQITPASYLGRALKQIGKHSKRRTSDSYSPSETESDTDSDDSASSEPSDSSSSSSETSTSSDDSSEREYRSKRWGHKLGNKKKWTSKQKSKWSKATTGYGKLKLIPPLTYDGAADS